MSRFDARVIGPGRAGGALAAALASAGWTVDGPLGRDADLALAASDVDLLILAVPDPAIAPLAAAIAPGSAVVCHLAGSLGLDVLGPHSRVASLHPLVSLPNAAVGAQRLVGSWFATAGDPIVDRVVAAFGGHAVSVADSDRVAYHAAAVVASNHLVGLLGQVERLAAPLGLPLDAFLGLAQGALDNVTELGPASALTGPVARGDQATVARHLDAIDPSERAGYSAASELARRLVYAPAGADAEELT